MIKSQALAFLLIFFIPLLAQADQAEAKIINLLKKWSADFNSKKTEETCQLFAKDLVASYPETPDRNYEEMCQHLIHAMNQREKRFHYDPPEIEQIILTKDLAVVRLIWTLKVFDDKANIIEIIREKGLDVFKLQENGSWKIAISYAYPI